MNRVLFSEAARKVLNVAVDHRRANIKLMGDAERGMRFNSDGAVLARLESMYGEVEFMGCPGPCIDRALQDAAESDYWYHYEKDYEMPECGEEDCEIEDE